MSFFEQLKQRKLVQWLVAYAAAAWLLLQFADIIGEQFQWSLAIQRGITIALVFGFAVAAIVAWYHGERGQQQVRGPEVVLIGLVAAAAGMTIAVVNASEEAPGLDVAEALSEFLEPDSNKVLVVPFRVTGAAPELAYLHEGMMDLVYSRLSGLGGLRAIDPRTTMAQLGRLSEGEGIREYSQDVAVAVADALGAGFVILGAVSGTAGEMALSASLLSVPHAAMRGESSVSGPQDSLTAMVNRLAVAALQNRAGNDRFAIHAPLPAVQAYLAGVRHHRAGRHDDAVREFDIALAEDSTLNAAVFGLMRSGFFQGSDTDASARGSRLASARREQLSPRDLRTIRALMVEEPLYDHFNDIENALAADPEDAELWSIMGRHLGISGAFTERADWAARSRRAFDRALALTLGDATILSERLRLHFVSRDTVGLGRTWQAYEAVGSTSEMFGLYRWRTAVEVGDEDELERARAAFSELPSRSLGYLSIMSVLDGLALDDAERAIEIANERSVVAEEDYPATYLPLARGRLAESATGFWSPLQEDIRGFGELIFMYDDYDDVKREFVAKLDRAVQERGPVTSAGCRLGILRGIMGDTVALGDWADQWELAGSPDRGYCTAYFRMFVEREERAGATVHLERLDSMLIRGGADDTPGNFVIALEFEELGEYTRALSAIRRRLNMLNVRSAVYLPQFLRHEGRIAALAGDTAGAITAYRHYLTLRTDPDPELQPEVNRVREELLALGGELPEDR